MVDPIIGDKPYNPGPQGRFNTGNIPININSTRDELIKAYPQLQNSLSGYPKSATIQTIAGSQLHFKKQ